MKLIVPDYYTKFKCIADRCRHSCCVGWEIDIDEDTLSFYHSIGSDFGNDIISCIDMSETPHFRLGDNERCPFLDERNLCRIISVLGEDALCDICADHPRFRNFFDSRTEMGLGLCCEAAAEIILKNQESVRFITLEDDGNEFIPDDEAEFFALREDITASLQDRSMSFDERISCIDAHFGTELPKMSTRQLADIFSALERLDPEWDRFLDILRCSDQCRRALSDTVREQLMIYFIWRHLAESLYDGLLRERLAFCMLSVRLIDILTALSGEDAAEIARMYSAEIEYSEENMQILLDIIGRCFDTQPQAKISE